MKIDSDALFGGALSRKLLVISGVLGLVGAGLLMLYLHRFEEQVSGGRRVQLLTALKPIERGMLLTEDKLGVIEVPLAYVEKRAIKAGDKRKILGVRAAHALEVQDTLMWSDLAISVESRELSALVQPGKRALTVRASEAGSDPAGNGLLRPGDYVDVFVTFSDGSLNVPGPVSVVLLQRVLVLAVGSQTEARSFNETKPGARFGRDGERELTLSLKVEEAQLLSLARERGTVSVVLRGPNDTKIVEALPDMPVSVLIDKARRETVQRTRAQLSTTQMQGPTRLVEARGSAREQNSESTR